MHRILGTLLLGIGLISMANADDHDRDRARRYYDRDGRDYHEWNEREDKAYRQYLKEQRKRDHEFEKATRKEQRGYWKWRHTHTDRDDGRDRR